MKRHIEGFAVTLFCAAVYFLGVLLEYCGVDVDGEEEA